LGWQRVGERLSMESFLPYMFQADGRLPASPLLLLAPPSTGGRTSKCGQMCSGPTSCDYLQVQIKFHSKGFGLAFCQLSLRGSG
jgi:hypothetical protein